MATLIFAQAKSIDRLAMKERALVPETYNSMGFPMENKEARDTKYDEIVDRERKKFQRILRIAKLLHEDYVELTGTSTSNWYFITVRPRPDVDWLTFYNTVRKFMARKFMLEYKLSFEQKNIEGNGDGFHVHIVANTTHRSKGECLRDTCSTFKHVAADNCVKVKPTRNPEEMFQHYCIDYKSDNEHKISTKNGDEIWRNAMGLRGFYSEGEALPAVLIKYVEDSIEEKKTITFK